MEKKCISCKYSYFTWDAIAEHIDKLICERDNCELDEDFICEHYEEN